MSWKSYTTATFASVLAAAVLGCGDDPVRSDPDPISITGVYDYSFEVDGAVGDEEVSCAGQGVITITQQSDSTFIAVTAEDGSVQCTAFGFVIDETSGVVQVAGEIDDGNVTFQFPLLEDSELCDASGEIEGDPVTGLSGTATCVLDPSAFDEELDPIILTGTWQADRTDD